jgi:hypothetical protein
MQKIYFIILLFIINFSALSQTSNTIQITELDKFCDCSKNIYDRPYTLFDTCKPEKGLLLNTGIFAGGAVAVMGMLYLLPEDVTS